MQIDSEAQEILRRVQEDHFFLRLHAGQRMKDRRIERAQVIHCAQTCFYWRWQEEHRSHLFLGYLVEGVSGGFSAVLDGDAIVVTVFKRRLTQWERNIAKSKRHSRG